MFEFPTLKEETLLKIKFRQNLIENA